MTAVTGELELSLNSVSEKLTEIMRTLQQGEASPKTTTPDPAMAAKANGHNSPNGPSSLPDPQIVRQIIRQRQLRAHFFKTALFADPAWDMLLDLTAASAENAKVSVTSLCIASGVPATTALRWINQMIDDGLITRIADHTDRRRVFVRLTPTGLKSIAGYFAAVGDQSRFMA